MGLKEYITDIHDAIQRVEVDVVKLIQNIFNSSDDLVISDDTTTTTTIDGYSVYKADQLDGPIVVGAWIVAPRSDHPDDIVTVNGVPVIVDDDVITI